MKAKIATITFVYLTENGVKTVHLSRLVKPHIASTGTKMRWLVSVNGKEFYSALRVPSVVACMRFLKGYDNQMK